MELKAEATPVAARTKLDKPELVFKSLIDPRYEPQYELLIKRYSDENHNTMYNPGVVITQSPFYNCQIYTIGNFAVLLSNAIIKEIGVNKTLEEIQNNIGKSRLLIDISNNSTYTKAVEEIFKESEDNIVFKQPYTNNTGSEMIMYMLKTRAIGYVEENDEHEDWDGERYYDEDEY